VATGAADGWAALPSSTVPQLPQKRAPPRFSSPQLGQRALRLWPQLSQKRRPAGFSVPQLEQRTRSPFAGKRSAADSRAVGVVSCLAMDFGFTLKTDESIDRTIALTRQAETAGFTYGWLFDSHVLWKECYPLLTIMALNSERLRLGTCVTNPGTREPSVTASALATLDLISDGRMVLGIGRGDSARRVMGKPPTTLARLEEATLLIRDLVEGHTVDQDGTPLHFSWTRGDKLPVWIAGYGPKALELTARIADGVILQLAEPDLIRWFVGQLRDYARAAGRDPSAIKVMAAAPAHVGGLADCRERVRWFPALVSNHVVDLVSKYDPADLPPALTTYVRNREGYNYLHHAEVGSSNASFVTDEVVDRFCVIGSVEDHLAKLAELADAGVDQFNIYLMNGDEEETLEAYGRQIVPAMRGVAAKPA
jgi:probable F420-dependent oxidoreductase